MANIAMQTGVTLTIELRDGDPTASCFNQTCVVAVPSTETVDAALAWAGTTMILKADACQCTGTQLCDGGLCEDVDIPWFTDWCTDRGFAPCTSLYITGGTAVGSAAVAYTLLWLLE